jgi:hypothetical protein
MYRLAGKFFGRHVAHMFAQQFRCGDPQSIPRVGVFGNPRREPADAGTARGDRENRPVALPPQQHPRASGFKRARRKRPRERVDRDVQRIRDLGSDLFRRKDAGAAQDFIATDAKAVRTAGGGIENGRIEHTLEGRELNRKFFRGKAVSGGRGSGNGLPAPLAARLLRPSLSFGRRPRHAPMPQHYPE